MRRTWILLRLEKYLQARLLRHAMLSVLLHQIFFFELGSFSGLSRVLLLDNLAGGARHVILVWDTPVFSG